MPVRLRDHLYWCVCGERVVFLDAAEDRYFSLSTLANDAFLRLAAGELPIEESEHLRSLTARGLLLEGSQQDVLRRPHMIEAPTCDFLPEPGLRAGSLEVLSTFFWEMRAAWLLRRRSLVHLLERAAINRTKVMPTPAEAHRMLGRIVSASAAASLVTRAHDRCLVRALGIRSQSNRRGLRTALVFGVRANPFAAHCWVQFGSSVLVGEFEQVRLYTPILVVP